MMAVIAAAEAASYAAPTTPAAVPAPTAAGGAQPASRPAAPAAAPATAAPVAPVPSASDWFAKTASLRAVVAQTLAGRPADEPLISRVQLLVDTAKQHHWRGCLFNHIENLPGLINGSVRSNLLKNSDYNANIKRVIVGGLLDGSLCQRIFFDADESLLHLFKGKKPGRLTQIDNEDNMMAIRFLRAITYYVARMLVKTNSGAVAAQALIAQLDAAESDEARLRAPIEVANDLFQRFAPTVQPLSLPAWLVTTVVAGAKKRTIEAEMRMTICQEHKELKTWRGCNACFVRRSNMLRKRQKKRLAESLTRDSAAKRQRV